LRPGPRFPDDVARNQALKQRLIMDFPSEAELLDELIRFPTIPIPTPVPVHHTEEVIAINNDTGTEDLNQQNQSNSPAKRVSNYIHKKCLVCNRQFFYSRNEDLEEWTEIGWAFRKSFNTFENYEPSPFHNTVPFCEKCTREAKKLLGVHKKFEALQAELERLETSIATAIVKSFPSENSEGPNYGLKKSFYDSNELHKSIKKDAIFNFNFKRFI